MRDPYEVLGVPRGATKEQVKNAYRGLAKKYHPDNYIDSPLADSANKKMQEINEAYDAIISGNPYSSNSSSSSSSSGGYGYNSYQQVREMMRLGRLDGAEQLLENMSPGTRDAQWYYLKGQINYQRGWTDQAYTYFASAYNMEPNNAEYRHAYENLSARRAGGFRTNGRHNQGSDCDGCSICQGLICANCCCKCFGGDLIPCC